MTSIMPEVSSSLVMVPVVTMWVIGSMSPNSTGSKPANSEVDVPLNYADYYYLEALLRSKKLDEKKPLF